MLLLDDKFCLSQFMLEVRCNDKSEVSVLFELDREWLTPRCYSWMHPQSLVSTMLSKEEEAGC